ncbi:MAG: dNTP triphosphohydrolase [Sphingobacteriales bacterium]|nr:MAG: dNTP triphosphohydrolase [Sphingobacteriales bacterium]
MNHIYNSNSSIENNILYSEKDFTRELSEKNNVFYGDEFPDELYRTPFYRDYARLIHSPCFRRLNSKTQLFPDTESDFFRNRLTHSIEVAQIGKSITNKVNYEIEKILKERKINKTAKIDTDLVEFACMAHDLGHPPFGHQGEKALNDKMHDSGGFEGNAQTLRILSKLEKKVILKEENNDLHDENYLYTMRNRTNEDLRRGLNLTYRSLASILKYDFAIPIENEEPKSPILYKGYYDSEKDLVNRIKANVLEGKYIDEHQFKTIECQIMDVADDIAYSVFDLEDSLKGGLISILDLAYSDVDSPVVKNLSAKISESNNNKGDEIIINALKNNTNLREVFIKHFYLEIYNKYINIYTNNYTNQPDDALKRENTDKYRRFVIDTAIQQLFDFIKIIPTMTLFPELLKEEEDPSTINSIENRLYAREGWRRHKDIYNNSNIRTYNTSKLVGTFVRSVSINIPANCENVPSKWKIIFKEPENITINVELTIEILKHFTYVYQITSPRLQIIETRGKDIVKDIFEAIVKSDGNFLPEDFRIQYRTVEKNYKRMIDDNDDKIHTLTGEIKTHKTNNNTKSEKECVAKKNELTQTNKLILGLIDREKKRIICDFIARMTDKFALDFYARLKSDSPKSIYKNM